SAFAHLQIGQTILGQVKSLEKGLALVDIDGQTVAMRLPHNVAPGDTLRLRFSGHMPQPVFLLEMPDTQDADGPQLSTTARMLSDIMQKVPERALPTLTPTTPLLGQAGIAPAELAFALRAALVRSGLFYESHLANWVAGQESLDGLMQEPQNRLAAQPQPADARGPNPLHVLLSQQLQVLESPQFIWRGELWPGQPLEWLMRHDVDPERQGTATAEDAAAGWTSQLKLDLPELGTVTAHIRLDPAGAFSIRVVPENADAEPLLKQAQGEFAAQMAAAGCTLQSLSVEREHGETDA
ncbi:MAG: flagellar hook-length control protein FliK, partial [Gammaproteobacteria bacterium]